MAILTSLFAGVSGLNAFGSGLSVISDNIANMNTIGFKNSEISFADLISSGQGRRQIGRGVFVSDIRSNFEQGSFETTGNNLDLAVEGEGFFVMHDSSGAEFYTRSGAFNISQNGLVENSGGLLLQGIQASQSGVLTGQIGDINLSQTTFPPFASTQIDVVANLDSRVTIPAAFDVNSPSTTSNFSTSITVNDSLGNGHLVSVYFRKNTTAPSGNTWQYFAVVDAADAEPIAPATTGVDTIMANGTLTFGPDGALNTASATTYPLGGFDFSGGATQNQVIAFDFGISTGAGGTGLDGITQFGASSGTLIQTQDGFASGSLSSVAINKDGIVTGLFTNGESRTLAQLTLARFNNKQGLSKVGDNLYTITADSGQPVLGVANAAGSGRILSNSLELSNSDLAQQFVKMIEYQRGFQANSRIISTTDDLLQELVNIRR